MYSSYAVEIIVNKLFQNKLVPKILIATFIGENLKTQNRYYIQKLYKSTKKSGRDCSVLLIIWKYENVKY